MAENSPSSSPPKPLQAPNCGVDRISPPNPQNPTLSSPAITPSLSSIDLPQVSSPQLVQSQIQITPSGTLDFPSKPPATSQQHSGIKSPTSNFQMQPALQRSGCISRINQIQQQFGPAIAGSAIRQVMYGGQMSFGGQQQQLGGAMTRPGMMNQARELSMLPSQAAAHFNIQSQMLVQPRQKTGMQGAQFHTANSSGQAMQGMQALAAMSPLASNSQLKANGPLSYGQLRLTPTQLRQQLSQQAALTSPQKLSQSLQRGASSPQIPGLTQNGPSALGQGSISQQLWLKQIQSGMPSPVSPSYHIQQQQQRQQQAFLPQQISQLHQKSLGLSQQHISQLVQAQLRTTQHHPAQFLQQQQQQQLQLQQLQQLQQNHQQHQQQPSPKALGSTVSKSSKGSQPGTSASGLNMPGEISSQGTKASNQLLGKRKIQDLVSQVDSSGRLDPEVEDLLLELADDFIDSVTTFACRLAKHRKSSTLESKDLLLHLEKNWHLTPGFLREEQKNQKVLAPIDVHKKRIELVRTLMESQERERDAAIGKAAVKQGESNSAVDRLIKSSPSSEQAFVPAGSSHVVQKILRF